MTPAAFPGLPVTVFPGLLAPSIPSVFADVSTIDATAAVAAIVWAAGGLIALRIALALSRRTDPRKVSSKAKAEQNPRHGLRDAA
jgi:hypothetical protein